MAFNPLQLGTAPDDGTGESLRDACEKINTMLEELYDGIENAATSEALTTAIANWSSAVGELNDALAGKASAASVSAKADLAQVIRRDATQAIVNAERLLHAQNSGLFVTLAFDLIDSEDLLAPGTWELPPFPADFYLHEARLVVKDSKSGILSGSVKLVGSGDMLVWTNAPFVDGGSLPGAVVGNPVQTVNIVPAAKALSVIVDSVTPSGSADPSYGLVLWFRGFWAA